MAARSQGPSNPNQVNCVSNSLRKRSLQLAGHPTSVALEPEFWRVLEEMAQGRGVSLAGLLAAIDAERGQRPLASACRTSALAYARRSERPAQQA